MKRSQKITIAAFTLVLLAFTAPPKKIKVYLIGDSTIADKTPAHFLKLDGVHPSRLFLIPPLWLTTGLKTAGVQEHSFLKTFGSQLPTSCTRVTTSLYNLVITTKPGRKLNDTPHQGNTKRTS